MSAIDRAVDAVPLIVGVLTKSFEQTLPNTLAFPAVEAMERGRPGTKVAGRSRHGAPGRLHHRTASTKLRSSRPGRPARFLMPSAALILCHCCSSNGKRTIVDPHGTHRRRNGKPALLSALRRSARPARPAGRGARGPRPAPQTSAYKQTGPTSPHGPSGTGTFTGTRERTQFRDTP